MSLCLSSVRLVITYRVDLAKVGDCLLVGGPDHAIDLCGGRTPIIMWTCTQSKVSAKLIADQTHEHIPGGLTSVSRLVTASLMADLTMTRTCAADDRISDRRDQVFLLCS